MLHAEALLTFFLKGYFCHETSPIFYTDGYITYVIFSR